MSVRIKSCGSTEAGKIFFPQFGIHERKREESIRIPFGSGGKNLSNHQTRSVTCSRAGWNAEVRPREASQGVEMGESPNPPQDRREEGNPRSVRFVAGGQRLGNLSCLGICFATNVFPDGPLGSPSCRVLCALFVSWGCWIRGRLS